MIPTEQKEPDRLVPHVENRSERWRLSPDYKTLYPTSLTSLQTTPHPSDPSDI